jgi:twitching motility protein PilT
VVAALQRALNFYQSYDAPRIRATLASVLQCVLVKHLLPRAQNEGMVAATELLVVHEAARDVLRQGDLANVNLLMRMADAGSGHSLDRSLLALVQAGTIRFEDAFARAEEKAWLLEEYQATAVKA